MFETIIYVLLALSVLCVAYAAVMFIYGFNRKDKK